jgi:hypothetical protein
MMPRVLSLLLLSLTLLTAACKKEDEPTLLGRWYYDSSHVQEFDRNGNLLMERMDPLRSEGKYNATSDTRIDRYDANGQLLSNSEYTREGKVLHIKEIDLMTRRVKDNRDVTIVSITDQYLVWRYTSPNSGYSHYVVVTTFTR